MLQDSEDGLWYVVHDYVEVNLIGLIALRVKSMFQSDYVRVEQFFHYLELSVLVSFVLIHLLDGHLLIVFVDRSLEDDPKAAIAHHPLGIVRKT